MATKHQIERLSARIEALAAASEGGVVYVWRGLGETDREACERHWQGQSEARKAKRTYVIGWMGAQ